MKTFRGGLPVGRKGQIAIGVLWAAMIIPLRLGIANVVTFAMAILALLALPLVFIRSRIEVADDGVFLRWLFFSRFVPYAKMENVWYEPGVPRGFFRRGETARLTLYGGDGPQLTISSRAPSPDLQQAARAIEAGMASYYKSGQPAPFDSARLARGGAKPADWVSRIRALARMPASYRDSPPSREELARIIGDPHASEEQRAAAAVGLAALGEEGKTHLRVARETTADPKLRVAIDAAIADDDDAIAAALDDVGEVDRERA
jgi:hypothetical protein